jgi:hypothetical protein
MGKTSLTPPSTGLSGAQFETLKTSGLNDPECKSECRLIYNIRICNSRFIQSIKSSILTLFIIQTNLYKGNAIPKDRFIYQDVLVPPSKIAFGLIVALDLVGCLLSMTFLFFNIYFRNNRYVSLLSFDYNERFRHKYTSNLIKICIFYDAAGKNMCQFFNKWLISIHAMYMLKKMIMTMFKHSDYDIN